jgi:hypothetical protein
MSIRSQQIYFAKESNETKSNQLSVQKMVNMYTETSQGKTKGDTYFILYNTSGLTSWNDFGVDVPIYGMRKMGSLLYVVVGLSIYKIDSSKTSTLLGTLSASPDLVKMEPNGTELFVKDEAGNGYIVTSSTLTSISDGDFNSSEDITTMDGYGISLEKNSSNVQISSLNDLSAWDPLDFVAAFGAKENGVGLAVFKGYLWVFGENQTEIYQNTGNVDFPFELLKGSTIDKGCKSKRSIVKYDRWLCWLGDDNNVYMVSGLQYTNISTNPIIEQIRKLTRTDNAQAVIYNEGGHIFYKLTFPKDKKTFVYDISEGVWENQESRDKDNIIGRWRGNVSEFFANENLIGDFEKGVIWESDPDVFVEGDKTMISTVISKTMFAKTKRVKITKLRIDTESGVGTATGEGVDAQIMLQVSKDGGRTYGAERWRSLGKIGEYTNRAVWRNLGLGRQWTFKIKISDPNKRYILGAYVDFEVLEA